MNGWERIDEANSESATKRPDSFTVKLFGTIEKKDGPVPYLAISKKYLDLVNSTDNHPLKGKFKTLSELNKLEKCFPKDVIEKLPGGRIFANKSIRFSSTKKVLKAACLPYIYNEKTEAILYSLKFTERLHAIYKELQEQEQSQQPQQPQPQEQQPQPTQDQVTK